MDEVHSIREIIEEYIKLKLYFLKSIRNMLLALGIQYIIIGLYEKHPEYMLVVPVYVKLIIIILCVLAPFGLPAINERLDGVVALPTTVFIIFELFVSSIASLIAPFVFIKKVKEFIKIKDQIKKEKIDVNI